MKARSYLAELVLYLVTVSLAVLIVVLAYRLHPATLSEPFNWYGDTLFFQAFIQNYLETGSPLFSERRGAPFGTDMRDFPAVETVHLLMIRGLSYFSSDIHWLVNVFFLLGFPLTAATALLTLRTLRVGALAAVVGSLLFAFTPYHYFRFGHLFLASYYLVPLIVLIAIWTCRGELSRGADGQFPWGRWLAALLIAVLASGGGVYYAFFGCFFLAVAGLACAVAQGRLIQLVPSAVLVTVITAGLFAQIAPTLHTRSTLGTNRDVATRFPVEAEVYGLRLVHLLLPIPHHQIDRFARLNQSYLTAVPGANNEAQMSGLGLVGAVGLVGLIGYFLLWPRQSTTWSLGRVLGLFTLAGLLLATVTGFAYLFAYFISPMIRAYNRISIFLAFFSLTAVCLVLDPLLQWAKARGRGSFVGAVAATLVLLVGGLFDQSPRPMFHARPADPSGVAPVREFVAQLEAILPPDSMVLQLPIVSFPESTGVLGTGDCDHFRLSVTSRQLRWSHGMVRGRYPDAVFAALGRAPLERQIEQAALMGFAGIHLDRKGYPKNGADMVARLRQLLDVEAIVCANGRDLFFDLRPWTARFRERVGASSWTQLELDARHPTEVALWCGNLPINPADPDRVRGFEHGVGAVELFNPLDLPRTITLSYEVLAPSAVEHRVHGRLLTATHTIPSGRVELKHQLVVPPGKHRVEFTCVHKGKPIFFQLAKFDVTNQPLLTGQAVTRINGK